MLLLRRLRVAVALLPFLFAGPALVSGSVTSVPLGGDASVLAALEPQTARSISFAHADGAASLSATPTTWRPLALADSVTALASGVVWSPSVAQRPTTQAASSSDADSPPAATALPFLAVASGRSLRLYTPRPADAAGMREFRRQDLLSSGSLLQEAQGLLCACSMHAVAGNSSSESPAVTRIYVVDSQGRLAMMRISEGRVSAGGSGKAWVVSQDKQPLVQPSGIGKDDEGTKGACPPCSADSIFTANASSSLFAPKVPGLFWSPSAARSASIVADVDGDGKADYVLVRSSVDATLLGVAVTDPISAGNVSLAEQAERQSRSALGLDVQLWLNRGADSDGRERFTLAERSGLGRSLSSMRAQLRSFAASSSPGTHVQLLRLPHSLAVGHFDSDPHFDLTIAVTELVNRSTETGAWPVRRSEEGVLVQRRLITLFGEGDSRFRFDAGSSGDGQGSVSAPLPHSSVFLPGVQLVPAPSAAASRASLASRPLLSSAISLLPTDEDGEDADLSTEPATRVMSASSLAPFALLSNRSTLTLALSPFPFAIFSRESPFFDAHSLKLREHQLSILAVVEHGVSQHGGRLFSARSNQQGQWKLQRGGEAASGDSSASAWADARRVQQSLSAPVSPAWSSLRPRDFAAMLPALQTGAHPCVAFSSVPLARSAGSQRSNDVFLRVHDFSLLSPAAPLRARVLSSPQLFFSVVAPPVPTLAQLGLTDSSSDPAREESLLLMRHQLAVAEYARADGWTEGARVQLAGLAMAHGRREGKAKWRSVIGSPIAWTLLALLCLVLSIFGYCCWRRRSRLCRRSRTHQLTEIRTVMNAGASPVPLSVLSAPMHLHAMHSPPDSAAVSALVTNASALGHRGSAQSSSSPEIRQLRQLRHPPMPALIAPPNSAAAVQSPSAAGDGQHGDSNSPHHAAAPLHSSSGAAGEPTVDGRPLGSPLVCVGEGALLMAPPRSVTASLDDPAYSSASAARSSGDSSGGSSGQALSSGQVSSLVVSPADSARDSPSLVHVTAPHAASALLPAHTANAASSAAHASPRTSPFSPAVLVRSPDTSSPWCALGPHTGASSAIPEPTAEAASELADAEAEHNALSSPVAVSYSPASHYPLAHHHRQRTHYFHTTHAGTGDTSHDEAKEHMQHSADDDTQDNSASSPAP